MSDSLCQFTPFARFADRAKQITNKPVKNLDPKDLRIQELQAEVERCFSSLQIHSIERTAKRVHKIWLFEYCFIYQKSFCPKILGFGEIF